MVPSCARYESSAIESGYFFYSLTSQVRVQFREVNIQEGLSKQKNVDSKTSGYVWMRPYPDLGCVSISMSMVAALELDIKHLALSL